MIVSGSEYRSNTSNSPYPIHAVKSVRFHGSVIHAVFGCGSRSACTIVSHPLGRRIVRALPLLRYPSVILT